MKRAIPSVLLALVLAIAAQTLWGLAAVGSDRPGPMPADTEARISGFAELVASAVVAGYRDEQKRQMAGATSQRPLLIDSLLEGRVNDHWSLWEVAGNLGE